MEFTLSSFAALRACPEQREGTVRNGRANELGMTRFRKGFNELLMFEAPAIEISRAFNFDFGCAGSRLAQLLGKRRVACAQG